jgi:thiol-disulfide isomerase/thioredoxin
MKKILFALMSVVMFCACNDNVCKISGTITDPVDTVHLVDMSGALLDAAAVNNGAFTLKCEINPEIGVSIIRGEDYDPISLIPDSKKITVSVTDDVTDVKGSPLSQKLQEFQQWAMTTYFAYNDRLMALMDANDTEGFAAVEHEMKEEMASHCREVYKEHQSDPLGLQAMSLLMNFIDKEEFFELYEQAGKLVKEDAAIGGYYEHLKSLPEKEAVITLLDNGEVVTEDGTFEDYVGTGKYTLVDFWASWCGPCRKETPNVVAVFEKYRDKGLVVIGIPVNDKMDAMEQALKDLGIHYPQVIDPSMALADKFHVEGIPYIILFDPEGNIVATDLRETQIEAAVSKVLK